MPQVTIYVPQDLADALDRHRERLNVSQICAQALRRELGLAEDALASGGSDAGPAAAGAAQQSAQGNDRRSLVERLRLEKQRSLMNADEVERAQKRAEGWLQKAHYQQIKHFGELAPPAGEDPEQYYAETFRMRQHEEEVTREWGRERRRDGMSFSIGAYRRAWHEHVRAFWKEVEGQI